MTKPPPAPDTYLCPVCDRWKGEHMKTGHLSRHGVLGGSPYDLCKGSLRPLRGLPHRHGDRLIPGRYTAAYDQPRLFEEP